MPESVFLHGRTVRLEPLAERHIEALAAASAEDRSSYAFTPVPHGVEATAEYVAQALAAQQAGRALPFATVRVADGMVIGSTRFCEMDYWQGPVIWPPAPRGPVGDPLAAVPDAVEIGATWLSPSAQGSDAIARRCPLLHNDVLSSRSRLDESTKCPMAVWAGDCTGRSRCCLRFTSQG